MATLDFDNILTVGALYAKQIQPPDHSAHANNTTYFYIIRRVNSCGDSERTLVAAKVSIDASGNLEQSKPNSIFEARAEQLAGSRVKLFWYYCPLDQDSKPACFNIYYDNSAGQINYENPITTIRYTGRKFYSYQSGPLECGRYLFAIRVKDAKGKEDSSLAKLPIQITTSNLCSINILSAKAI